MDIVVEKELTDTIADMDSDSTYVITRTKREKDKISAPFTLMGNGLTSKSSGRTSIDVLAVCEEMNKVELALFKYFRNASIANSIRGEHIPNIVKTIGDEDMTPYLKTGIMKTYLHLEELKVVKRMKRGTYLLNPYLVIPSKNSHKAFELWDDLVKEDNDNTN